jgi:hypothetical protein
MSGSPLRSLKNSLDGGVSRAAFACSKARDSARWLIDFDFHLFATVAGSDSGGVEAALGGSGVALGFGRKLANLGTLDAMLEGWICEMTGEGRVVYGDAKRDDHGCLRALETWQAIPRP